MKNDWEKILLSLLLFGFFVMTVTLLCLLAQIHEDFNKVVEGCKAMESKVENHERIMRAYEFYNWHYSLKMFEEEEKQE